MASNELSKLKEYLESEFSEKSKDHLVYPFVEKVFGKTWQKESRAQGADAYIPGRLIIELKTKTEDRISGLFQALHYGKKGLSFNSVCVVSYKFISVWNKAQLPKFVLELSESANSLDSPSSIGQKLSKKVNKSQIKEILNTSRFIIDAGDFDGLFSIEEKLAEFEDILKHIDSQRLQINPKNFIQKIDYLKSFFQRPMDAIHCFYTIANYWDETSTVPEAPPSKQNELNVNRNGGKYQSDSFIVSQIHHNAFRKFIESHYIFTNQEAGVEIDYYFSRFDEVISRLDPEYTRQHGIFFTDINLSKFALWFVHHYYEKRLSEKYVVFDPAAGSGNLVTSWRRNHLKHKIVSELQPDLLKIIERRMKMDNMHQKTGFTIVPKTSDNKGLNFLDKSAGEYFNEIKKVVGASGTKIDKPFAFLLNPPYKNTDENEKVRTEREAAYSIDNGIVSITGDDAGKERYVSFLAQILNLCKIQVKESPDSKPIILIFTPTSWLIPRPTYVKFRNEFDKYFKYEKGFLFIGNEFFKISGRFPITFTIWSWNYKKHSNNNNVILKDYSHVTSKQLNINWNQDAAKLNKILGTAIRGFKRVCLSKKRESIKDWCGQKMYDFKRNVTKEEKDLKIVGGLPLKDSRRENKKTYGILHSECIGFMDDSTPVRIKQKEDGRFFKKQGNAVWFRLDNDFKSLNKTRILNCPPDKYGYAAFDINSSQKTFSWFAISKALSAVYPVWANQMDLWKPNLKTKQTLKFYSLSFAFGLAENRCVVTKFEKDNPISENPEVFVYNPLCPLDENSFWCKVLDSEIKNKEASDLVDSIKTLYKLWNKNYSKGEAIENVGLKEEPYFKYFSYNDFLTPFSGLIQIKKYAEIHACIDLANQFEQIDVCKKKVKKELYDMLINDIKYFD